MNDVKHWLDDASEVDDFERAVLRSGLHDDPPPGKEGEVWSSLARAVAIAPAVVAVGSAHGASVKTAVGSASKAAAVWLGVGKGFVLGLAVYGAAAGVSEISERLGASPKAAVRAPAPASVGARAVSHSAPRPADVRAAPVTEASAEPTPAASSTAASAPTAALSVVPSAPRAQETSGDAPPLPSVATFPEPQTTTTQASQLQAEAAALRSARAELRAGKLADAFATLEASQRRFTAPELDQEREALLIELLFRSGQTAAAGERARAFLAHFPESPHTGAIRQLVER